MTDSNEEQGEALRRGSVTHRAAVGPQPYAVVLLLCVPTFSSHSVCKSLVSDERQLSFVVSPTSM